VDELEIVEQVNLDISAKGEESGSINRENAIALLHERERW